MRTDWQATVDHPAQEGSEQDRQRETVALVARARAGDQTAWNALVERYSGLLWWMARRYRLNEADAADAVQVTWLQCVQHLDRIREPARLGAWLVTVCEHECLRMLRMVQRCAPADIEQALAQEPAAERDPDPCELVVRGELHAVLHAAIADLPERQRRVLNGLLEAGDDPDRGYAAVALALDMPIGSLGPTRGRALARLSRDPRVAALEHPGE